MDPKETTAEELFNALGQQYEDAFADDVELRTLIHSVVAQLPPASPVLDVGCGTGRPVSDILARHGHSVHGIDVAEEMVRLARAQVPGSFHKVDMRRYRPPHSFGAVFAIFSLFSFPPADVVSMVYRFAEWLQPGAVLVLAVVTSDSLGDGVGYYDGVWDCMRVRRPWMGAVTVETLLSSSRWKNLLVQVGLTLEMEQTYDYLPRGQKTDQSGRHHLLVARKTGLDPVFGPHPVPKESGVGSWRRDETAWQILRDRLFIDVEGNDMRDIVQRGRRVLDVGGVVRAILANGPSSTGIVESIQTLSQTLPSPDQDYDIAVLYFALDCVSDRARCLGELARVMNHADPNTTIIIIQGAPENTCVQLLNSRCVRLSADSPRPIHQGCLLQTARDTLAHMGYISERVRRINSSYVFEEEDVTRRCEIAADALTRSWYHDDPNQSQMEEGLVEDLGSMSKWESGLRNQLAVLTVRPA
ncbi:S-adenosyl-L-methionine-dependent methyltransferase [Aspergillus campestris IBT 28561]|uniref:S-adenosyl-L-methionine-dependent methyltransferase n=1 Tax=Aspergillus campestris (strain IBT 28561) TaxID=1392248 RepID=A0A2I1D8C0_ASPC2|nr:S-adenosyl-L-methionine-dependent methyltransferase [Aspergillus campestris IBT 28561]PKY06115.1 S-adenosyl-L-methionine-dependent methyltransferase [Aspergillus campestris IBT 28561]